MSLWEKTQQDVFSWRARQAGLSVELVYSQIQTVPEVKAALAQGFLSPTSDPLTHHTLPPLKGDTLAAGASFFGAEVWC